MRKISSILLGSGIIGFQIGGAGLDGPGAAACEVLAAVSFVGAVVAYILRQMYRRREEEIETTKKAIDRAKAATFVCWMENTAIRKRYE